MFLFSGIEWRIMQQKNKTIRALLMIRARSIPVDLVTEYEFLFHAFVSDDVLIFMQPLLIVYHNVRKPVNPF